MEEEVEEEYKAAATVDSRRACPSGCPRAVRGGVTAKRRQAALGITETCLSVIMFGNSSTRSALSERRRFFMSTKPIVSRR